MEFRTSRISATALSGGMPAGGSRRATSKACSRACGSARSCIHPCSSHSRMAPASCSTKIAQPRGIWMVRRRKDATRCKGSCSAATELASTSQFEKPPVAFVLWKRLRNIGALHSQVRSTI